MTSAPSRAAVPPAAGRAALSARAACLAALPALASAALVAAGAFATEAAGARAARRRGECVRTTHVPRAALSAVGVGRVRFAASDDDDRAHAGGDEERLGVLLGASRLHGSSWGGATRAATRMPVGRRIVPRNSRARSAGAGTVWPRPDRKPRKQQSDSRYKGRDRWLRTSRWGRVEERAPCRRRPQPRSAPRVQRFRRSL